MSENKFTFVSKVATKPGEGVRFPIDVVEVTTNGKDIRINWNEDVIEAAKNDPITYEALTRLTAAIEDSLKRALNVV